MARPPGRPPRVRAPSALTTRHFFAAGTIGRPPLGHAPVFAAFHLPPEWTGGPPPSDDPRSLAALATACPLRTERGNLRARLPRRDPLWLPHAGDRVAVAGVEGR
jgi:hypothetical protein